MVGYLENRRTLAGDPVEVRYVFQDFSSVPAFYRIPEGRTKPFGTVHALLCAEEAVDGPFCVINADDYYGIDPRESWPVSVSFLRRCRSCRTAARPPWWATS